MTETHPKPSPGQARISIVDAVKGIAIILMVFGHTEQGALHRQIWAGRPNVIRCVEFSDTFIYSFHMPAFFFVSGLFLMRSVDRRGKWPFIVEKARTLLYPYLLWSFLAFIIDPLTMKFREAGRLPTFKEHIWAILTGNSSWFLITLFATMVLALLVMRMPPWIQVLAAVMPCILIPESDITILYKPFWFFPFVVAGMWFSPARLEKIAALPKSIAWMGFGVLLVVNVAVIWTSGAVNRWDRIPVGLVGTAMLVCLCCGIRGTVIDKALGWYGVASLGIFILSPFFQGAAREFVVRVLHTTNPGIYLTLVTLCAATIPAVIWSRQDKLHVGWLFQWPTAKIAAPQSIERRDHAIR